MSETISSVDTTLQHASSYLFKSKNIYKTEKYIEQTQKINALMSSYLHKRFLEMGLSVLKPKGAFYLFPSFKSYREKLSKLVLKQIKT